MSYISRYRLNNTHFILKHDDTNQHRMYYYTYDALQQEQNASDNERITKIHNTGYFLSILPFQSFTVNYENATKRYKIYCKWTELIDM